LFSILKSLTNIQNGSSKNKSTNQSSFGNTSRTANKAKDSKKTSSTKKKNSTKPIIPRIFGKPIEKTIQFQQSVDPRFDPHHNPEPTDEILTIEHSKEPPQSETVTHANQLVPQNENSSEQTSQRGFRPHPQPEDAIPTTDSNEDCHLISEPIIYPLK